jgi:hypothetical protein
VSKELYKGTKGASNGSDFHLVQSNEEYTIQINHRDIFILALPSKTKKVPILVAE